MRKILKLQKQLANLCKEKHKRDIVFQLFGFSQCNQLTWEINNTIKKIKEVLL